MGTRRKNCLSFDRFSQFFNHLILRPNLKKVVCKWELSFNNLNESQYFRIASIDEIKK